MSHIPPPNDSPYRSDAAQPWAQQPAYGGYPQQQPQPGMAPGWGAPQDPAATQAAWRYSARAKNNTVAWLLWLGGPFLVGLPIHDFYFGAIGRGLAKLGLVVLSFVALFGGVFGMAFTADSTGSDASVWPFILGMIVFVLCLLGILVWWIVDGVTMTQRLERTNDRIRHEIAAEQRVDPWSF